MIYWGNIGIMEKKMETTIMGFIGYIIPHFKAEGHALVHFNLAQLDPVARRKTSQCTTARSLTK